MKRTKCSVEMCDKQSTYNISGVLLCGGHRTRLQRHGDVLANIPLKPQAQTPSERFWAKVEKTDNCWLWTAQIDEDGYGRFWDGNRPTAAHRWAFGEVPAGLEIDHLCRVRRCVRPDHLEAVTSRVNTMRGDTPAARYASRAHCSNGHPFSGDNLYERPNGGRKCRKCHADYMRSWRQSHA